MIFIMYGSILVMHGVAFLFYYLISLNLMSYGAKGQSNHFYVNFMLWTFILCLHSRFFSVFFSLFWTLISNLFYYYLSNQSSVDVAYLMFPSFEEVVIKLYFVDFFPFFFQFINLSSTRMGECGMFTNNLRFDWMK